MNGEFQVAVQFAIIKHGKLLLGKRARTKDYAPGIWEIPSGRLLPNEDPYKALQRESMEELGVVAKPLTTYNTYYFERGKGNPLIVICFLCELAEDELSKVKLSSEHEELRWVELREVSKKLFFKEQKNDFQTLLKTLKNCDYGVGVSRDA